MAFLHCRRFNFFTHKLLESENKGPEQDSLIIDEIIKESSNDTDFFTRLKNIIVTCSNSGRGQIVLGDSNGFIHKINKSFDIISFKGFDYEVITIQQIIENPYVIASGSDELNPNLIKIWNFDKIDAQNKNPICVRIIKNNLVFDSTSRITCLKVTDCLTFMSVGYNNGNVIISKGDILKDKSLKQKKIELCKEEITSIFLNGDYRNSNNSFLSNKYLPINLKQNKQVEMFITTSNQVYYFESKNDLENWNVIENKFGCSTGRCCCLINDGKNSTNCLFILGRKDAIYFYHKDGQGPCLAFENEKLLLNWYKGYLIVVCNDQNQVPVTSDTYLSRDRKCICTIYDIQNKYIAFSETFSSINQIFAEWGYIFILLKNGKLIQLTEKDMGSKLDLLFKKQQYSLAIELTKSQNFNSDNLTDIFKKYADHLYKQGDFEGAINQYIKTIGKLEPSYVIKKYLDGQKVKNLTLYLQNLHKNDLANKDHTSLYLNCLTKSKNLNELTEFLNSFKNENNQNLDYLNAITVLRNSKLYEQALFLCEQFKCYDLFFKIEIEDKKNYLGAIDFIEKKLLNEKDLFFNKYFTKYVKILFKEKPEQTIDLLKKVCEKIECNIDSNSTNENFLESDKSFFYIEILMNNPDKLMEFLEFLKEKGLITKNKITYNTLIELYLQNYKTINDEKLKNEIEKKVLEILKNENIPYDNEKAILICRINQFNDGLKYLYEKLKMYDILIYHCVEYKENDQIIQICEKFGNQNNNLWLIGFSYFAKLDHTDSSKITNYLLKSIDELRKKRLLPFIKIIDILSRNQTISLQITKNYLINSLAKENELIAENENLIKQYKDETERIRKQIDSIENNGQIYQTTKCSVCNSFLDLPCLHFLCNHSFHLNCFESHCGENENECPICLPEHKKVLNLADLSQTLNNEELNEKFFNNIQNPEVDSFTVVSNYFSKNLFSFK